MLKHHNPCIAIFVCYLLGNCCFGLYINLFKSIKNSHYLMIDQKVSTEKSPNDNFAMIEQISKKCFSEIEHSVPHLQQTLFDLQNECYKTWKNAVSASISLQREFATKTGFNFIFPDAAQAIVDNVNEEILKYRLVCNKILITTIESGTKNAKTWNDNASMFVDLNRKIMQYWLSAFTIK